MMNLWEILVESNTFNFIILALIFVFVFKKLNIAKKFDELQEAIEIEVKESDKLKQESEENLSAAQKSLDSVGSEVEKIVSEAEKTAEIMAGQIVAQAVPQIEIIKNNAQKVIENDIRKTKTTLSFNVANASLKLSEQKLKDKLNNNENLHQIFIDEAISELEGLNI